MEKQRRIRNDANTTFNVIDVSGNSTKSEMVIQSETPLTPGCLVVPYVGQPAEVQGWDGSLGAVAAPTGTTTLPLRVVDLGGISGMSLISKFNQGDQVPVLSGGGATGVHWNVRIAGNETVTVGQRLTYTTDGTGYATAVGATAANTIGLAREDLSVADPDLPTFIRMEVLQ